MIQLLVNYWEIRSSPKNSLVGAKLDQLADRGVTQIATFVPWQAVESDISHMLVRFLQAIAERKMKVSLILSPELGVHYPNSGIPKDIFARPGNAAKSVTGQDCIAPMPPNVFALPSLLSPDFSKRYHNFLSRMDGLLVELGRSQPRLLESVTAVVTGSLWKYYRDPQLSSQSIYGGAAGDFSGSAAVSYRQALETLYGGREFSGESLTAANRWKTRQYEDVNRRWFYQQCEDVFRARSAQFVGRKARLARVRQIELHTPEADPGMTYSNFLQLLNGRGGDFARLSAVLDEMASRGTFAGSGSAPTSIHWSGLASFRTLTDSEKQFLILKSILLCDGRGGDVIIDADEWFGLSPSFRARAEALSRAVHQGELKLRNRALYLAPHLWSAPSPIWETLQNRVRSEARLTASLDYVCGDREAMLCVVDPMVLMTQESLERLRLWASTGNRVVALPRSPLYSPLARADLERLLQTEKSIRMEVGTPFQIIPNGSGKIMVYDLPEGMDASGEVNQAWQSFMGSLVSLAGIQDRCQVSDGRLTVIPLARRNGTHGVFILNGTSRKVTADLLFGKAVRVGDLAVSISVEARGARLESNGPKAAASHRFALEVPPCGVLPLEVDGLEDRLGAPEIPESGMSPEAELLNERAMAGAELPGFDAGESAWS